MEKPRQKILVVDDAANWRMTLETVLKPRGYEVTAASNVIEAIEAIGQGPYSAAILDVRLDSLDDTDDEGLSTVLSSAHTADPWMSFIVISSYYSETEVRRLVPEGVNLFYFDKNNFMADELIRVLQKIARRKKWLQRLLSLLRIIKIG